MQTIHPPSIRLVVKVQIVITLTLNLVYDANGNLVTGDGKYRVYNSFNQLAEIDAPLP